MLRAAFMIGAVSLLMILAACAGSQKGVDAGIGFDIFNTQSKQDKEDEKFFKSFYGKNHCYGNWASDCADDKGLTSGDSE